MFASLCAANKQTAYSQLLQMSTIYLLNNVYELLLEFIKGGYICLKKKTNLSHRKSYILIVPLKIAFTIL